MKVLPGNDPLSIEKVVEDIRKGEPVALPTETVYGLAANALCDKAVGRVFEIKKRPSKDPLIVHVSKLEDIEEIAQTPTILRKLASAFWPGPLTVILQKKT